MTEQYILIDNAWDPRNHKAILNICSGFLIEKIYLYHSYNHYSPETYVNSDKVEDIKDLQKFCQQKKEQGFSFIAADFNEQATKITQFTFPKKSIFVFGAERLGISEEVHAICDHVIYIPMVGLVKSFNISVAVSIFCYEALKQSERSSTVG